MYQQNRRKRIVAKQAGAANSVCKVVEIVGTSTQSWEDAAKNAVETAGGTLRDLRIAEVAKMDLTVKDGKVLAYLPAIFSLLVFDKK
jgi:flavin-binding protein dodecin